MRLSLLPVSYFKDILNGAKTLGEYAREAIELGLDAIDITVLFLKDRDSRSLDGLRRSVEIEGIKISGASTYPDFTHPEKRERERQKTQFAEDLAALAEVGVKIVRVTAGQAHPGISRQNGISWALEGILGAVETAASLGIELVFENHSKPGVWEYPDFDFPSDIFLEMADILKTTAVKIQYDTANPIAYGDDPLRILDKVIGRIEVVHAADTKEKGRLVPSVIGKGLVPFQRIFEKLKSTGYDGWISIEEASGTGATGVRGAVEFIRKTWNNIR